MRKLLCGTCGTDWPRVGSFMAMPAGPSGEPAEMTRVVKGLAAQPRPHQRVVSINGAPEPLPLTHYDCDMCGKQIVPGSPVTCVTVWTWHQPVPPEWEREYMQEGS